MVTTAVIPLAEDYTDSTRELYNNTANSMAIVGEGNHTIVANSTDMTLSIDGVSIVLTGSIAILMADQLNILYQNNQIQLFSSDYVSGFRVLAGEITITITDNVVSVVDTNIDTSYECEWIYLYDKDGKYGMVTAYNLSRTYYVNSIDDIRGSNLLVTTSDWFSYVGADVKLKSGGEVTNVQYTLDPVSGFTDLYTITVGSTGTYAFDVDNSGNAYTVHPWIIVVPLEVTAHKPSSSFVGLVSVIPLMAFVGLIAAAAAMIYFKGKE